MKLVDVLKPDYIKIPLEGESKEEVIKELIEIMKKNRNVKVGKNYKNLVDGPSKLCMAFNITKEEFNGIDSCSPKSKLFFTEGEIIDKNSITLGKRIGIL